MEKMVFTIKGEDAQCEVFSGNNLFPTLVEYLKEKAAAKYVIITDSNVWPLHGEHLAKLMHTAGLTTKVVVFPAGEKSKNREVKSSIEDQLFAQKCGRDTLIIALGGGVTGDMAGFIAGTYMRGVPYIQVPTTTIAISDSSYGGKTGIDVPAGKNLIGVYHNPVAVFMDADTLSTLDARNYISGLIEMVKHGLIYKKSLYELIKANLPIILARKGSAYADVMTNVFAENITVKRDVVVLDPREKNLRKILNYGHTVGHAVEKLSQYELLHGEAIAIGIACEAFIAYQEGILSETDYLEHLAIIDALGLSRIIPATIRTEQIMEVMSVDKKARNANPELTLIRAIGEYARKDDGKVAFAFDKERISALLDEYRAQSSKK